MSKSKTTVPVPFEANPVHAQNMPNQPELKTLPAYFKMLGISCNFHFLRRNGIQPGLQSTLHCFLARTEHWCGANHEGT